MNEAPKKIWITNAMQSMIPRSDPNDPPFPVGMKPIRSTIYIRADLVDGLVEALEKISGFTISQFANTADMANECCDVALAALKALEEE
ncbi:MAG: hypothetical protein RLZ25_1059 [Pseudomonadota bacterium]|jgi:hypothetical protein